MLQWAVCDLSIWGPWKSQGSCESDAHGEGLRAPGGGQAHSGLCVGISVAECPMPVLPGWYLRHHPFLKAVDSLAVKWGQFRACLEMPIRPGTELKGGNACKTLTC